MLFSSIEFLLVFFPITYGVNFLLPKKLRNYWLLICSLFFYAWGEPKFVFVMIFSICMNYLLALWIEKNRENKKTAKAILTLDVAINLGILLVFKYLNFITGTVHAWLPVSRNWFPQTSIALPIGISFFTFQAMSYVIDVYRGVEAQRNPAYLGLYISLFPQLIAGPIVRYTTVMDQINERQITGDDFKKGIMRFLLGFNKKILLANVLSEVADMAFASGNNTVCMAWLGALCYGLQLYFDFDGYSDMAIGLGRMLGFHFLENFNFPYISNTLTEFWRRWHISLTTWFRDYVYFPLGGSRVRPGRVVLNLFIVWFLTGLWHGANWTYILWGILYGSVTIAERMWRIPKRLAEGPMSVRVFYAVFLRIFHFVEWVIFRSATLGEAGIYLKTMFGLSGHAFSDAWFLYWLREYSVFIVIGILCCTPVFRIVLEKQELGQTRNGEWESGVSCVVQFILFLVSFSCLVMQANNPFIYFNF